MSVGASLTMVLEVDLNEVQENILYARALNSEVYSILVLSISASR